MQCLRDLSSKMVCIEDADIVDQAIAEAYFLMHSVQSYNIAQVETDYRERVLKGKHRS